MTLDAIILWVAAWWVVGLIVVSVFMLTLKRAEAPFVFDVMRQHRRVAVRLLLIEAWIWPVYVIGLLALALGLRGKR